MIRVTNQRAIRRLAWKIFKKSRARNLIAVFAITLTCILFTGLYSTVFSLNKSFETQAMLTVGGCNHADIKYVDESQIKQFVKDPLVKKWGESLFLGGIYTDKFSNHPTELRYFNKNGAAFFYSNPTTGKMPKHKMDMATDTKTLANLGVKPKVGAKVKVSYTMGEKTITDTFTLTGYWKTNDLAQASEMLLSKSYVKDKLQGYHRTDRKDVVGSWDLGLMFTDSNHINKRLNQVVNAAGYQTKDQNKSNYVDVGVNWAFTSTQMDNDNSLLIGSIVITLLIMIAGYLIIYNIFAISVVNDIRYYGLLKTIGTTGRQARKILRLQATWISLVGIPIGLMIGYAVGFVTTPMIMSTMSVSTTFYSQSPYIFLGATVFTALTVFISLLRPARIAAKVSPIEAVKYTEGGKAGKRSKRSVHGARIHRMALSNLKRDKKKTFVVVLSLTLSIVILNMVSVVTKGIDIDKMISKTICTDFVVASKDYFSVNHYRQVSDAMDEKLVTRLQAMSGIKRAGKMFSYLGQTDMLIGEKMYQGLCKAYSKKDIDMQFNHYYGKKSKDLLVDVYGIEKSLLPKIKLVAGEIDYQKLTTGKYIIEIDQEDDYGKPVKELEFFKVGDSVKLDYIRWKGNGEKAKPVHDKKKYQVMAVVMLPYSMTSRIFNNSSTFLLPENIYKEDTKTSYAMSYYLDVKKSKVQQFTELLNSYTKNVNKEMSFDSKAKQAKDYVNFQNTVSGVGGALSIALGVIGVLNYINVSLTSVVSRRKEFSVFKSIGMTKRQMKILLVLEGMLYIVISIALSAIICSILNLTLVTAIEKNLWFFKAKFSLSAILLLTPVLIIFSLLTSEAAYRYTHQKTLVEQLREAE